MSEAAIFSPLGIYSWPKALSWADSYSVLGRVLSGPLSCCLLSPSHLPTAHSLRGVSTSSCDIRAGGDPSHYALGQLGWWRHFFFF